MTNEIKSTEAAAGEPVAFDGDSEATRAAFRAYDAEFPVVRRSHWQIWRDAIAYTYKTAPPAASEDADFKNFHRLLCERFGYVHDEKDWKRDQLSLIECIANWRDQFEYLDVQNHTARQAMRRIMARLTELLDEDRFAEIEEIVRNAGVEPPAASGQKLTDEKIDAFAVSLSALPAWHREYVASELRALLRASSESGEMRAGPPSDCSGDPSSCPDNEGFGCHCSSATASDKEGQS